MRQQGGVLGEYMMEIDKAKNLPRHAKDSQEDRTLRSSLEVVKSGRRLSLLYALSAVACSLPRVVDMVAETENIQTGTAYSRRGRTLHLYKRFSAGKEGSWTCGLKEKPDLEICF